VRYFRLCFVLACLVSGGAAQSSLDDARWREHLCAQLVELNQKLPARDLNGSALVGELEIEADSVDYRISGPAIFQLWTLRETSEVELRWWRKEERVGRALSLAVFECARSERSRTLPIEAGNGPDFKGNILRFEPLERAKRLEEYRFVRSHCSAIASALAGAVRRNEAVDQHLADVYGSIANRKVGNPLPCLQKK